MINWAITTSKARGKHGQSLTSDALQLSKVLQIPVLDRANRGLAWLFQQYQLTCLLVEEEQGLIAHWKDGAQLAFHPGMAVPRIKMLKDGKDELLSQVMDIQPGDHILDCTMGMANDAIVAAFAAGETGRVTALESSPVIYATTAYGLKHWITASWRLQQAMARIEPRCCHYQDYLNRWKQEEQFSVIYFDPMFEQPVLRSAGIAPLRREANYEPLTQETLEQARRIAQKRVVVKHRAGTLQQLQFDAILGGKYSTLAYGVLDTNPKGV